MHTCGLMLSYKLFHSIEVCCQMWVYLGVELLQV